MVKFLHVCNFCKMAVFLHVKRDPSPPTLPPSYNIVLTNPDYTQIQVRKKNSLNVTCDIELN